MAQSKTIKILLKFIKVFIKAELRCSKKEDYETPEQDALQEVVQKFKLDDEESNKKALVIFDISVNHGLANAGMMMQRALNKMGNDLVVDKKVGPKTLAALHAADPDEFCDEILKVRENFYHKIVANRPSQKVFLKG